MKKGLIVFISISLMLITFLPSFLSVDGRYIQTKADGVLHAGFMDYYNCKIQTSKGAVDGKAFLFPGFFPSWPGEDSTGVTVKRALGILIRDGNPCPDYGLHFNNDFYYTNWSTAYIVLFNGYFYNNFYGPWRLFEIDGTAKFVRVYFT
jgi:hypothetical protein